MKDVYKKISKTFLCIVLIVFLISLSVIPVKAEKDPIGEPYIDITFDPVAKENKNHGILNVFKSNETGYYNNSSITYGVDEYGTYMAWTSTYTRGGGFNLTLDKVIGGDYTIALKFSFTNTGEKTRGWKKIIDFQSKSYGDSGFYFYNGGQIQFYPESSQGPYIKNNEVVDLLIRRNGTTNKFEVYNRVGDQSILCYEFIDSSNLSVLSSGLGFFHDDTSTSSESSPGGKVYSVKIWDSYVDVDDVWDALDKEKEDSLSRYICRKIAAQEPTDLLPGWASYYECESKDDGSYKFFTDDTYEDEIEKVDEWKEEAGYVPQTKSMNEVISILNDRIEDKTIDNVTLDDKENIAEIVDIISKFSRKMITKEEANLLDEIDEKCEELLEKIDDILELLDELKDTIKTYTDKELSDTDKSIIKNVIFKVYNISTDNLTDEQKELYDSYIELLEKILDGNKNYTYDVLNGDQQEFIQGTIDDYTFRIDGNYFLFNSLTINDTLLLNGIDYTVTEGSTIIKFTPLGIKKLNILGVGTYKIYVNYVNSRQAIATLIIKKGKDLDNPKTLDNIDNYVIIGLCSLCGIVGSTLYIKKKRVN